MRTPNLRHGICEANAFDVYTDKVFGLILYLTAAGMMCSGAFYTWQFFAGDLLEAGLVRVLVLDLFDVLLLALAANNTVVG